MAHPAVRTFLRAARGVAAAFGLALFVILYTPATDWIAHPLLLPDERPQGDAIVVLSAWARRSGELNESGLRRAIAAGRLYRSGVAKTVVVTGSRPTQEDQGDALEASVRLLDELGVPSSAIAIEDRSFNTHDSAINVARLASARGWTRVVLVTDATHMRRARSAFAHEGLQVSRAPTMVWRIDGDQPSIRLAKLGAIVHEYGGLLYYRARGWI